MAIEQAKVGVVAARLMETLERQYEDDETAEITSVFLIVAVDHSGGKQTGLHFAVSPGMATHEGVGMIEQVKHQLLS